MPAAPRTTSFTASSCEERVKTLLCTSFSPCFWLQVASKQRDFRPFPSVAWRCVRAAAEAGVRGAALCLAYAYGTGQGLLGQEVLGGDKDPAQVD